MARVRLPFVTWGQQLLMRQSVLSFFLSEFHLCIYGCSGSSLLTCGLSLVVATLVAVRGLCMKMKSESEVAQSCPTAAHLTPPSMGFSRQDDWSGVPLPSPTPTPSLAGCISSQPLDCDFFC